MNDPKFPRVGIGVIVIKRNQILMGKRINAHGHGTWNLPGGHLEFGESLEACAKREVGEETGLVIENVRKGPYTNDIFTKESKHYLTIFMLADWQSGNPEVLEPNKCIEWGWFDWDKLPHPRFLPLNNLLAEGYSPFASTAYSKSNDGFN